MTLTPAADGAAGAAAVLPGAAVGVLGGGQLGRMLALAARRMGYRVHVFSPEPDSPAGQIADVEVVAPYDDLHAVRRFAGSVAVVTFEFENVPSAAAEAAAALAPVRPGGAVLHATQHRLREKRLVQSAGFAVTPHAGVASLGELRAGLARVGCPAVLKTAGFGYDGKGQVRIARPDDADAAWRAVGGQECVLEARVDFEREISVVAARGVDGAVAVWPPIENRHVRGILDVSVAPARVDSEVAAGARAVAAGLLEALAYVGVLCVELFVTRDGALLVNEIAPRPHNSGHLTIEASVTSQFEQQLRAVCGLPLGAPDLLAPAAMANLLGDLWQAGEPDWAAAVGDGRVKLHLYGKRVPRPGRKMGHLTALGSTAAEAEALVVAARAALGGGAAAPQ